MAQGDRFRRKALKRGYKVDEVDEFLDRAEATLARRPIGDPLTAADIRDVVFRTRFGGYDEWQVDLHLDRLEKELDELASGLPPRGSNGFRALEAGPSAYQDREEVPAYGAVGSPVLPPEPATYGGGGGFRNEPSGAYGRPGFREEAPGVYGQSPYRDEPDDRAGFRDEPGVYGGGGYREEPSYGGGYRGAEPGFAAGYDRGGPAPMREPAEYRGAPVSGGGWNEQPEPYRDDRYRDNAPYPEQVPYGGDRYREEPSYGGGAGYRGGERYDNAPPYVEQPSYGEAAPYADQVAYADRGMGDRGGAGRYQEGPSYNDQPQYLDQTAYAEVPPYGSAGGYRESPSYSEGTPYREGPSYSEGQPYSGAPYSGAPQGGGRPRSGGYPEPGAYQESPSYGDVPYRTGEYRTGGRYPEPEPTGPQPVVSGVPISGAVPPPRGGRQYGGESSFRELPAGRGAAEPEYAGRYGKEMTMEMGAVPGLVSPFTNEDKAVVAELRSSFRPRRFGSGYDPGQVERLFDAIQAMMEGRSGGQVSDSDLMPGQFGLVQGGYFEDDVDEALRQVRGLYSRRVG
ncbi:DivIVA domain-containing protein [Cryptosporangium aurantiacum]|uniref:Cell wall synthesis protein Wag31 n=1 Tax=Cryptosporangium aurantiacum TaxID=134849 RepID=A0A1M7HZK1_9ACTN|nr:DivIVA domain-containing protein [Cryptosporangium aurantiacum]SHM33557.1 DivIVA domain-containing protein [Cryptosporangium aurantiacum]